MYVTTEKADDKISEKKPFLFQRLFFFTISESAPSFNGILHTVGKTLDRVPTGIPRDIQTLPG